MVRHVIRIPLPPPAGLRRQSCKSWCCAHPIDLVRSFTPVTFRDFFRSGRGRGCQCFRFLVVIIVLMQALFLAEVFFKAQARGTWDKLNDLGGIQELANHYPEDLRLSLRHDKLKINKPLPYEVAVPKAYRELVDEIVVVLSRYDTAGPGSPLTPRKYRFVDEKEFDALAPGLDDPLDVSVTLISPTRIRYLGMLDIPLHHHISELHVFMRLLCDAVKGPAQSPSPPSTASGDASPPPWSSSGEEGAPVRYRCSRAAVMRNAKKWKYDGSKLLVVAAVCFLAAGLLLNVLLVLIIPPLTCVNFAACNLTLTFVGPLLPQDAVGAAAAAQQHRLSLMDTMRLTVYTTAPLFMFEYFVSPLFLDALDLPLLLPAQVIFTVICARHAVGGRAETPEDRGRILAQLLQGGVGPILAVGPRPRDAGQARAGAGAGAGAGALAGVGAGAGPRVVAGQGLAVFGRPQAPPTPPVPPVPPAPAPGPLLFPRAGAPGAGAGAGAGAPTSHPTLTSMPPASTPPMMMPPMMMPPMMMPPMMMPPMPSSPAAFLPPMPPMQPHPTAAASLSTDPTSSNRVAGAGDSAALPNTTALFADVWQRQQWIVRQVQLQVQHRWQWQTQALRQGLAAHLAAASSTPHAKQE